MSPQASTASTTIEVQSRRMAGAGNRSKPRNRAVASCPVREVSATLVRNDFGVLLELKERPPNGPCVVVLAAFTRASSLEDWCADDPLRFEMPNVHEQIRREAEVFWRSDS